MQPLAGKFERTLTLEAGKKYGMAVTPDGTQMVVSFYSESVIRVYTLAPLFALLRTIEMSRISAPSKLCLTPGLNIIVCDWRTIGMNFLEEFTITGTSIRTIPAKGACTVAMHPSGYIACGTSRAQVQNLLYYCCNSVCKNLTLLQAYNLSLPGAAVPAV